MRNLGEFVYVVWALWYERGSFSVSVQLCASHLMADRQAFRNA